MLAGRVACLKESQVQSVSPEMIRKLLNALLWPSLDSLQELPLVLGVELLDALLELDLGRPKRVDLEELLQVEEGLRDRELVRAPRCSQEAIELCSIWQLQDQLVDLAERLWIDVLKLLALQDRLHEEGSNLADAGFLELHLRVDSLNSHGEIVFEDLQETLSASRGEVLRLLQDEGWHDIVDMNCWHLDLDSFNSITGHSGNLCAPSLLIEGRPSKLESHHPLDLGYNFWALRISHDPL